VAATLSICMKGEGGGWVGEWVNGVGAFFVLEHGDCDGGVERGVNILRRWIKGEK
jgi:hypothetical protein